MRSKKRKNHTKSLKEKALNVVTGQRYSLSDQLLETGKLQSKRTEYPFHMSILLRYIAENNYFIRINKCLRWISTPYGIAMLISILAMLFFANTSFASEEKEAHVVKDYSLSQIKEIASEFSITITDWQHYNYKFQFDKNKTNNREAFIKWLKTNLHNWALEETTTEASFFLLPLGVKAKDIFNSKNSFEDLNFQRLFDQASDNFKMANPTTNVTILNLKEVKQLSNIANEERLKHLFFMRTVKTDSSKQEYTFSLAYNEQKDKFLPYELNGSRVTENKMEGFVCYDTVLKYIEKNSTQFKTKQLDSWVFFYFEDNSDTFIGLSSTDQGIDVISLVAVESKQILNYYIKGTDNAFNSATLISTSSGSELVLMDSVSSFEGKTQ